VVQIIPFNFPLLIAAWKLASALPAGNCSVLNSASPTPWSILKLMEVVAGIVPPGTAGMPLLVTVPSSSERSRSCRGATSSYRSPPFAGADRFPGCPAIPATGTASATARAAIQGVAPPVAGPSALVTSIGPANAGLMAHKGRLP
jgi:Aldehyde dehydrogenase family